MGANVIHIKGNEGHKAFELGSLWSGRKEHLLMPTSLPQSHRRVLGM